MHAYIRVNEPVYTELEAEGVYLLSDAADSVGELVRIRHDAPSGCAPSGERPAILPKT